MKIILSGYEGSKKIVSMSSWLIDKYLPKYFQEDVVFLNYGEAFPKINEKHKYVSLKDKQESIQNWSSDILKYLKSIDEKYIIFALDDFLIADEINYDSWRDVLEAIILNYSCIKCVRLCGSDFYPTKQREFIRNGFLLSNDAPYSVVAQYCLWEKETLENILSVTKDPWHFEIEGSRYFSSLMGYRKNRVYAPFDKVLNYCETSALSKRWNGVNVTGLKDEDLDDLSRLGYIGKEIIDDKEKKYRESWMVLGNGTGGE